MASMSKLNVKDPGAFRCQAIKDATSVNNEENNK